MLNLFQKYRRPAAPSNREQREQFSTYFFAQDDHAWISAQPQTRIAFEQLLARLPSALLVNLMRHPLLFVPSQSFQKNGAARYQMGNTIVVFPEYQRLLTRKGLEAVAFLAHEVAMVLYEIENVEDKDPLMAEVEADKFVCDIGLADELEQLLLGMDESSEKRLRLTYLTFKSLGIN
jgi:hypothetical protein